MLLHCLRLGISTGIYGLVMTNLLNDIIMGEAKIGFDPVGLRTVDPGYVNIMTTGHQHAFFRDLEEYLAGPEAAEAAASVGAGGIRIVGCTCVGQDFQLRNASGAGVFCGHAGKQLYQ